MMALRLPKVSISGLPEREVQVVVEKSYPEGAVVVQLDYLYLFQL